MTQDIKGYRELSSEDKDLINEGKTLSKKFQEFADRLKDMPSVDQRWLAIAVTDVQKGMMALTRSIARPESF